MRFTGVVLGAAAAIAGRPLLLKALKRKFDRDLARLNRGEYASLLKVYDDDAVLRFAPGDHRWAGDWAGKRNIERFLQNFTAARLQGRIRALTTSGPPWALTIWVRFDDHADAPSGERLYENRTVLVLRTRWGRVVEHEDFYLDTERIGRFDRALDELGVTTVARAGDAMAGAR